MNWRLKRFILSNKDIRKIYKNSSSKDLWACVASYLYDVPLLECLRPNYSARLMCDSAKEIILHAYHKDFKYFAIPSEVL